MLLMRLKSIPTEIILTAFVVLSIWIWGITDCVVFSLVCPLLPSHVYSLL